MISGTFNAATPAQPSRGILGYQASLEDEIFDLQMEVYPTRQKDLIPTRWRWMFMESAARLGLKPMIWTYRTRQRVVAHQGVIPVRVKIAAAEHVTGWFVETMASEEVRGKAIGPMLIKKATEDLPFALSLGQTPQMRELQLAMGWRQVAPLETLAYMVNPAEALRNRVPNPALRRLLGAGVSARHTCSRWWNRQRPLADVTARPVSRFGRAHDELWEEVKPSYPCAVVRDSSYLNWKYADQPGQEYVRYELRVGGRLRCIVVLLVCEADDVYPYRRAFLVDLVAPLDRPDLLWAALELVRNVSAERRVALILTELLNRRLSRSMKDFGFSQLEPRRFLLVSLPVRDSALGPDVLSPDNWFVIRGDSDIDRPW